MMNEHPLRRSLSAEVHARPFTYLQATERATHLALFNGEDDSARDREKVAELCRRYSAPPPADGSNFHLVDLKGVRLRWERHTEFSTYTFFAREAVPKRDSGGEAHFSDPVIERLPQDWLESLPGEVIAAVHLEFENSEAPELDLQGVTRIMGTENFAASGVAGGAALAWMNFLINEDGFGRVLVRDRHLRPRQAGRLMQRLFEIETYRMMALLAFPLARRAASDISRMGRQLTEITREMEQSGGLDHEQALLDRLTALSGEIERLSAETSYRFGAARAYYALVVRRIAELREERLEGFQTIEEFMDRRLAPAMRTCEAVAERLDSLAERIPRSAQLLRTHVDIAMEAQNRDLLASMDRRAQLQLRLQETVEGLSVAAITYYGVGLVAYIAKALKQAGVPVPTDIVPGLAVPALAAVVWIAIRRLRSRLMRHSATPSDL